MSWPARVALVLHRPASWLLGWTWWHLLPIRRRLAVQSHQLAFPDREPRELRRTVGELAWSYVELACGVDAEVVGLGHLPPTGALGLAGHAAGWDLALVAGAKRIPISIFVRRPTSRLAAWAIDRLRRRTDVELLPVRGSMAAAEAALQRGRLVVFVQDQRHNDGIEVDFLGRPALTSAGFAALAWKTRAPLLGIWQHRLPTGRHRVEIHRLPMDIPADRDQAIHALTAESQRFYEMRIRERPWSWWWLHDRWRKPQDRSSG